MAMAVAGYHSTQPEAEDAGQLPQWLLPLLSPDERLGLLRLSIFPLAITLDMATCVLPSTCMIMYPLWHCCQHM